MKQGSGGARPGAGRKRAPLVDKIKAGEKVEVLNFDSNLSGADMPPPEQYLTEQTKGASENIAGKLRDNTWKWLRERKCDVYINPQLVEQYAMSCARWIQAERAIHTFGFLAKHPTTGMPISSPYVKIAQDFLRQSSNLWLQIFGVIKDNCTEFYSYVGDNPNEDLMETILNGKFDGGHK